MTINPLTAIDFYKADHRRQYPEGTEIVYSNFTARSARHSHRLSHKDPSVVFFGLQYFIESFLSYDFTMKFFKRDFHEVIYEYQKRMDGSLGAGAIDTQHIANLHRLGYLPLEIKALPEGSLVPIGVPMVTIKNTHPDFFWLTNYIESVMSAYLWKPITSATTAFEYKKLLTQYAKRTGTSLEFVKLQAHDFSFRGMSSIQDAMTSGAGHLTSFKGTDSVVAIDLIDQYYKNYRNKNFNKQIGCSVPATEHSVMCMGGKDNELETFRRLILEVYPKGIVSIVSDTWDYWKVITEYLPTLKDSILNRDGTVVIRPDSGDPVKIICGDKDAIPGTPEYKGSVECLWEIFGGTKTDTGHKLLDNHIGLIYGDSITLERAQEILYKLEDNGFASGNVVLGIGSYTYQYVTRDTYGFAVKATAGFVNGQLREIYKDPKTDDGTKKSLKGLLRVEKENGKYVVYDQQSPEQEAQGALLTIWKDEKRFLYTDIEDIRKRLNKELNS